MARALVLANAGRQGPVVIGLPEDVLAGVSDIADVAPVVCADPGPTYDDLQHLAGAIDAAQWPLLLVGGRVSPQASRQLQAFAERLDLPLVASFRCQDAVDNRSPIYCGHAGLGLPAKLKAALASSDLIVALGTSIDEITSGGYATIAAPSPRQRLVHVHPDPAVIGRNHHALLPIVSSIDRFAERLDDLAPSMRPGMVQRWSTLRRDMRQAYETSRTPSPSSAPLQLDWVVRHLSETLPADAILTNGAGNYAAALHRGFTYKVPGTQLAPVSGSMGYGLPAAIAAKLARPGVDVVAFAGDGCLQMTVQELATAVQYNAAILVVVANNAMLGTVRTAQERRYPGRVIGSSLVNPDFAALAHAHGAFGVSVTTNEAFTEAVKQTRLQHGPAVIELALGPDQLRGGAQA
jgi:acetolactate synthase-1/2/3 large subunit